MASAEQPRWASHRVCSDQFIYRVKDNDLFRCMWKNMIILMYGITLMMDSFILVDLSLLLLTSIDMI